MSQTFKYVKFKVWCIACVAAYKHHHSALWAENIEYFLSSKLWKLLFTFLNCERKFSFHAWSAKRRCRLLLNLRFYFVIYITYIIFCSHAFTPSRLLILATTWNIQSASTTTLNYTISSPDSRYSCKCVKRVTFKPARPHSWVPCVVADVGAGSLRCYCYHFFISFVRVLLFQQTKWEKSIEFCFCTVSMQLRAWAMRVCV